MFRHMQKLSQTNYLVLLLFASSILLISVSNTDLLTQKFNVRTHRHTYTQHPCTYALHRCADSGLHTPSHASLGNAARHSWCVEFCEASEARTHVSCSPMFCCLLSTSFLG